MNYSLGLILSFIGCLFLRGQEVRADPPTSQPVRISVETGKTGEPISKYIYGPFIEHRGRCIYGGIGAEMLEDRKFYYDIGAGGSPWHVLGGAHRVAMEKTVPFVGSHMPRIMAPGGIVQGELALRGGRRYVGRIWLAGEAPAPASSSATVRGIGRR